MPPYLQIHWEYMVLVLAGGTLLTAFVWLAVAGSTLPTFRAPDVEGEGEHGLHVYGEVSETNRRVPLFLLVLFVTFWIWALVYTIGAQWFFIH